MGNFSVNRGKSGPISVGIGAIRVLPPPKWRNRDSEWGYDTHSRFGAYLADIRPNWSYESPNGHIWPKSRKWPNDGQNWKFFRKVIIWLRGENFKTLTVFKSAFWELPQADAGCTAFLTHQTCFDHNSKSTGFPWRLLMAKILWNFDPPPHSWENLVKAETELRNPVR